MTTDCNCPECGGYPNHMGVSLHNDQWWMPWLILLGGAIFAWVMIGCSGQSQLESDLHWHPSKISCPDDRWTPQNGYTLQRIEAANGQEWCMDFSRGVIYPPKAGAHSEATRKPDSEKPEKK